jgi:hypothetical protein
VGPDLLRDRLKGGGVAGGEDNSGPRIGRSSLAAGAGAASAA